MANQSLSRQEEIQKETVNIEHIANAIRAGVESLGLNLTITDKNRHGEPIDHGASRIVITHPLLKMYRAEILGREWNDRDRASLHVDWDYNEVRVAGSYGGGSPKQERIQHSFIWQLTNDERDSIEVPKDNYSGTLSFLQCGFKATKNPKLIYKDVFPCLEKYLKVVELAEPRINQKISQSTDTISTINAVARLLGYYEIHKAQNRDFPLPGGRVLRFSETGEVHLEITTKIDAETAIRLASEASQTEDIAA